MLPWKLRISQIIPVNQNLSSVYFSIVKFQLVSCNLFLAMIWQMTYTHKLPKLCLATWRGTLTLIFFCLGWKIIIFVLVKLRDNLFTLSQVTIFASSLVAMETRWSVFLWEQNIFVSSRLKQVFIKFNQEQNWDLALSLMYVWWTAT